MFQCRSIAPFWSFILKERQDLASPDRCQMLWPARTVWQCSFRKHDLYLGWLLAAVFFSDTKELINFTELSWFLSPRKMLSLAAWTALMRERQRARERECREVRRCSPSPLVKLLCICSEDRQSQCKFYSKIRYRKSMYVIADARVFIFNVKKILIHYQ